MEKIKLDIKYDIVFQYVFGQNTEKSNKALKGIIETYIPGIKIKSLQVLNPRVRQGYLEEKQTVMDILCQLDSGKYVQVEMQIANINSGFFNRLEYYNAQLLVSQEMKGENDCDLEACYTIVIANFKCIDDDQLIHEYGMRDENGEALNWEPKLNISIVELPKCKEGSSDAKEQLSYYLRNYANENKHGIIKKIVKENALCAMIEDRMKEISESQKAYFEKMLHEKYLNDKVTREAWLKEQLIEEVREEALHQGINQGISQGISQGIAQKQREMIVMMRETLSTDEIAKLLKMDIKEVEEIMNK